jgi:hypothetical protein
MEPLQNLHAGITSYTLSRQYKFMVHQIININKFQELLYSPPPVLIAGQLNEGMVIWYR